MQTVTISVPEEVAKKLVTLAAKLGIDAAVLARRAVENLVHGAEKG